MKLIAINGVEWYNYPIKRKGGYHEQIHYRCCSLLVHHLGFGG